MNNRRAKRGQKVTTWVLVADGARARILTAHGKRGALQSVLPFDLAASHAPTHAAVSDRAGRSIGTGSGSHHAYGPTEDWHQFEKETFAREIAQRLDKAASEQAFDKLVLVAPPETLGNLRAALDGRTRERVAAEIGKDLTHLSPHNLRRHLPLHHS